MSRDIIGEIIFWLTLAFAALLYVFSAPSGLPWSGSTGLALAYSGYVSDLPNMVHPVWGFFIEVFEGHFVALSAVAAAVAGGLIGAIVNRYLGWRMGFSASLVWIVMPPVWNRAITGAHGSFWAFGVVLLIWLANAMFLVITRKARWNVSANASKNANAQLVGFKGASWRTRINIIASWIVFGVAIIYAIVSISFHDYKIGEVASAYARVMLDEAGDRTVVLNGIADYQMVWEAERKSPGSSERLIQYRHDENYRTQLVARIRREWPTDTNLWVSAQIGISTLASAIVKSYPERVYVMTGQTTTHEKWLARWEAMKPFLNSEDAFLPAMRRAFAYEGNVLGNELQKAGKLKEAWEVYLRVFTEIDTHNVSAAINLNEMIRHGYKADVHIRTRVEREMKELHKMLREGDVGHLAMAIVSSCGPVMQDEKEVAKYQEMLEKRLKELRKEADLSKLPLTTEMKSLVEWNNEMVQATQIGDNNKAASIARKILSNPKWRGFIPANAIMGMVMSREGDYEASEAFYRVAVSGVAKPPAITCNDYADTLMRLKRFKEAEKYARLAVEQTKESEWLFRLTLAEALNGIGKNPDEVKQLVNSVLKNAPIHYHGIIRKEFSK